MREIYVFVDVDGVVRYVGCSMDAKRRVNQHWRYRSSRTTPCAAWLRSLDGPPRSVVVDEVDDDHVDAAERMWVSFFREISGDALLNVATGGATGFTRMSPRPPASNETRRRLSEANRGKVVSDETRQKMREATSARWRSGFYENVLPEKRPKQSEAMRRRWASMSLADRQRQSEKISRAQTGRKHSPETKQKMREAALAREARKREEREAMNG